MSTTILRLFAVLVSTALMGWLPNGVLAQAVHPLQESGGVAVSSFSLEGFSEIDDYHLDIIELRQLVAAERAKYPATLSVDELHQIADAMTLYIRGLGYVFHTMYLPPQKVRSGVVELYLQEGILADVHVINQTSWPSERFSAAFGDVIGEVLYGPAVEKRVQALKAQTGFRVFAFYSRGSKSGEARLNLRVEPADKRSFSVKADNYGSESSGKRRLIAHYTEHQLTGHFDRLSVALLRSVDDVDNLYGSIRYSLPFRHLHYLWDISASNNQFELGDRFAALGMKGDTTTLRTGVTRQLNFRPGERERLRVGIYEKRSNLDDALTTIEQEESRAITLEWFKDKLLPRSGWVLNGFASISHGTFDRARYAENTFNKLDVSGVFARGAAQGRWRNVLQASVRGQYSDVNLPSIEGFALTGPYGVRSYGPGGFNADRALLATAEWSFPSVLMGTRERSWRLEPLFFMDWATGTKLALEDNGESEASFSGVGAGLKVQLGKRLSGQVTLAKPLDGELDGITVDGDDLWLFEILWR